MANLNIEITDEWLYQTMPLIDQALLQKMESEVDYEYKFSDQFERKMRKLIVKEKRLNFWYRFSRRTRSVVAVVAAAIVMVSLLLSTVYVQAYCIHFFETIMTAWKDSTLYTYLVGENWEGESDKLDLNAVKPKVIPQGYEIVEETKGELRYSLLYENDKKEIIDWNQEKVTDALSIVVDAEYDWERIVEKNGRNVTIYEYADGYKIAYYEYETYVFTIYADHLEVTDILAMLPD